MARTHSKTSSGLRRFVGSTKGSIAILAGMFIPLLIGTAGGAFDFTRIVTARGLAQTTMDTTLLHLASSNVPTAELQARGTELFNIILKERGGYANVDTLVFAAEPGPDELPVKIDGQAVISVNTYFLRMMGMPKLKAPVGGSATPPSRFPVEIALVLDVSGSMNKSLGSQSRIAVLKEALSGMFDVLDSEVAPSNDVYVSVVPYSSSVNIGDFAELMTADESVKGTKAPEIGEDVWASERTVNGSQFGPYILSDASPDADPIPFYSREDKGISFKPKDRMLPLTGNDAVYKSMIEGLDPTGMTAAHLGMIWGFYALSPKWGTVWDYQPADYDQAHKVIVVLTDGAFNKTVSIGAGGEYSNKYFQSACDLAISKKISVYSIALSLNGDDAQRLTDCVEGGTGGFISADSASELKEAFRAIAEQIGVLRISS